MADRNMTEYVKHARFTTREGMLVEIPPSDFFRLKTIPGVIDPFLESATQQFPLWSKLTYADRVFRYCKNGGVALVVAALTQDVVPLAGHIDEVIGSTALGAVAITYTPAVDSTDDLTANQLADSYIHVNDDTGEGYSYRIKSHPAIAGAVAGVITLYDPVLVAHGANATATVHQPHGGAVIVSPNPLTAQMVGVPVIAVTASYYHWEQVEGPCPVLVDGTLVISDICVNAAGTPTGAVMPSAALETDGPVVGTVMAVNIDAEHALIWLSIPN